MTSTRYPRQHRLLQEAVPIPPIMVVGKRCTPLRQLLRVNTMLVMQGNPGPVFMFLMVVLQPAAQHVLVELQTALPPNQ